MLGKVLGGNALATILMCFVVIPVVRGGISYLVLFAFGQVTVMREAALGLALVCLISLIRSGRQLFHLQ